LAIRYYDDLSQPKPVEVFAKSNAAIRIRHLLARATQNEDTVQLTMAQSSIPCRISLEVAAIGLGNCVSDLIDHVHGRKGLSQNLALRI
jgi:hypothetical protein